MCRNITGDVLYVPRQGTRGRGNIGRGLVRINLVAWELVRDLHHSDISVQPSLAEGLAHIILRPWLASCPSSLPRTHTPPM